MNEIERNFAIWATLIGRPLHCGQKSTEADPRFLAEERQLYI